MGEVYVATDTRADRQIALKLLAPALVSRSGLRRAIYAEGLLASALDHPHICTIFEIGEAHGQPFVAMEYVDGESLDAYAGAQGVSAARVLELGIQLADALQAAHRHGVVHRDLTGHNIVITPSGQARILDFGLASGQRSSSPDPASGGSRWDTVTLGAPEYASPEQVTGREVDARSDLFSLGVVLHQLLTGRLPFAGENRTELFRAIVNNPAIPVDQLSDAVPVALSKVVTRLLAKNREQRYQSAADVLSDLRRIGQPARSMSTARARQMTHSRWFHRVVGSAAGVMLSVGGILPATIVLSHEAEAAMRSTAAARSGVWTGLVGARAFAPVVSSASSPDSVWIGNDGTIVYDAWRRGGHSSIWTVAAGEGAPRVLQGAGRQPSLSADGRVLVFIGDGDRQLYRFRTGDEGPVRIVEQAAAAPVVSRDGRAVVYRDADTHVVWMVAVGGGDPLPVTAGPIGSRPLVSPDGLRLAYASGGRTVICDLPRCTNMRTLAVPAPRAWTPDSQAIAYVGRPRQANVWAMPIDGTAPRQMTWFTERAVSSVAWSPDGTRLAVARVMTLSDLDLLTRFR